MKQIARGPSLPTPAVGELLTPQQAAARLNVTVGCLIDWRYRKKGPPVAKLGKLCRYPSALLDRWIAEQLQRGAA